MATTNSFNNVASIAKMAMDVLENNLTITKHVNRQYEDQFRESGAKNGDTANIRIPGFYSIRHGNVAVPQGYNDTYKPVTLTQHGADLQFTTKELRLNVEDGDAFKQNVLNPLIAPVANYIDSTIAALYSSIPAVVGTPGTLPTDLTHFLSAGAILDSQAVPRDGELAAVVDPFTQASMIGGLKTLFNPQQDIAEQYRSGNMGRLAAGMKFSMDQNIVNHTVGTYAMNNSAVMNGSTVDGATTIVTQGWTSGGAALKIGDNIQIAGVYAVNPVSKASTGQLKNFAVTADISDTTGAMTIAITPAIIASGPTQNVTAVPLTTAKVYVYGKNDATYSAKVSPQNLVFHKDAFGLVCVDLPKPEGVNAIRVRSKKLNIAIRMIDWYDGRGDQSLMRLDILFGAAVLRPTFAARVAG